MRRFIHMFFVCFTPVLICCSCYQNIDWEQNDFGSLFQFESFDLTVDDVIELENSINNITNLHSEKKTDGIYLLVEDGDDVRYYKFDQTTTKLIYVRYNIKKGNLYAKFKNAFGNPDIRNDISFWYGHIGAQHITLASSGADQWSYWEYEFIVSD